MSSLPRISSEFKYSHSKQIAVEIVSLRCVDQPYLRAVASIRVYGDLLINGVRVVCQAGRLRVQLPQYRTHEGEWTPVNVAGPASMAAITDAVLEAWRNAAARGWR